MNVVVNGSASALPDGTTLADLVVALGADPAARGVAVALDGEVVPRSDWPRTRVPDGGRVEVLGAIGGG